jgi:hypothetical protein
MWDAYKRSSKLAAKAHLANCSISFRGASISGIVFFWRCTKHMHASFLVAAGFTRLVAVLGDEMSKVF